MFDAAAFVQALRHPDAPLPQNLRVRPGADATLRFAVYRNNVMAGLIDALGRNFSATRSIVGDEFFQAMADVFVRGSLPRSCLMHRYGEEFPQFLEAFEPVADMPYLADVARLERARTRAFHAADVAARDPSGLTGFSPDRLADLRMRLHPSCEILSSEHPIVTIWRMNAGESEPASIDPWEGESALVHRRDDEVCVLCLLPGEAAFMLALQAGGNLQLAAAQGSEASPVFSIEQALATLFQARVITAYLHEDDAHD
jgi:hypothetical protein